MVSGYFCAHDMYMYHFVYYALTHHSYSLLYSQSSLIKSYRELTEAEQMEKVDKMLVSLLKEQHKGNEQHALDAKAALDRLMKGEKDKQSSLRQLQRQQTSSRNNSSRSKRSRDDFDVDKELEAMEEEMKDFEDTSGEANTSSKASSKKRAKVGAASNEQDESDTSDIESENQSMSLNHSNEQAAIEESMKKQAEKESEEDV